MPLDSSPPNALGINSFSGPMGEKEAPYGATERLKVLSGLAPPGSPQALGAPRRAKRAALKGKRAAAPTVSPQQPVMQDPHTPNFTPPATSYDMQMRQFWTQLAAEPGASQLVQQYAQQVNSG